MSIKQDSLKENLVYAANSRMRGVYPQKQEGLFMQRIKVFGGRISAAQLRVIAKLAQIYTPNTPMHLTTRQDIELHNVQDHHLEAIQKNIEAIGLTTFGGGGDTVRNITVCAGCEKQAADIFTIAESIVKQLSSLPEILDLPRKFKISFSGCSQKCAKPFINDLGFVAEQSGLFTVIGAGSLGHKPALGIELRRDLPAEDIAAFCIAALHFYNDFGDRENRRKARFRHLRQRLGDEAFLKELNRRFEEQKSKTFSSAALLPIPTTEYQNTQYHTRLNFPNGDISAEVAMSVADFCKRHNLSIQINFSHGLELYHNNEISGDAILLPQDMPPQLAEFAAMPTIVACPGCKTCPNGLTDCCAAAEQIRARYKNQNGVEIHISGCPNDCAQSVVADIGLIGILKTIDGKKTQAYRLFTNGGNGRNDRLADEKAIIPASDAANHIISHRRSNN